MESCMGTIEFCPMLTILFVEPRMSALQMMVYEVSNKPSGMCLTACQDITMLSIYIGFTAVVVSIFTQELRTAPSTPRRSP